MGPAESADSQGVAAHSGKLLLSFLAASVAGLAALGAVVALRQHEQARERLPALSDAALADLGRRATVVVVSGPCQGSGFFVTPDLLLTNAHVMCAEAADVQIGGGTVRATIVEIDDELDLALLEAEGAGERPLRLADALTLNAGDRVLAAGAVPGHPVAATTATVTQPLVRLWGVLHVEADAGIEKGNSGGPLLNDRGEVVAVISKGRIAGGRRWSLALPVNYAAVWLPAGVAATGDGWDAHVAEAARHAEAELAAFDAALERPTLLGAHFMPYAPVPGGQTAPERALVVVVAAPASVADAALAEVTVRLTCGDTRPQPTALSPWLRVDQPIERTSLVDVTRLRPFLAWARKQSHAGGLVLATGISRIDAPPPCRDGRLALLEDGAVTGTIAIE